jgi:hypothetical protein
MEINNLRPEEFADIFNMTATADDKNQDGFNRTDGEDGNIFNNIVKTPEQEEADRLAAEAAKADEELDADGNPIKKDDDDGIFVHDEDKVKLGRKAKYDFSDTSGYLENRINAGKFVKIEEEDASGVKKAFIPKTPEEFDEFFELQISHKLEEKTKEVSENWYKQLSPAWQTVAKYAEMVNHPSEMIPYIQGVQNIDSISEINEKEVEGAEQIVRYRMQIAGDSEESIKEQIEALKETNKLVGAAERFKPLLVQQEQRKLAELQKQKQVEEYQQIQMINDNRDKAIEKIEAAIFGKQKLKDDEKAVVFDMIAIPDEQLGGYAIYSEIDKLYETKDFETLRDIALFLKKKESFIGYMSKAAESKVAEGLQKKLKVSVSSSAGSQTQEEVGQQRSQPVIRRENSGGFSRR